jgi:hypothetical protein
VSCTPNISTTAATAAGEAAGGLWLDASRRGALLSALRLAADAAGADLGCRACAERTCTHPHHRQRAEAVANWRGLAQQLATVHVDHPPVAVSYHRDAARRWLTDWAADEFGIDESFTTVELTIAAKLEDLLRSLADNAAPQVWTTREPLEQVRLWRTADGVDGAAMITADLRLGAQPVRLATCHQGFDDFLSHEATSGIDAAVEALGRVADLVNAAVARLWIAVAAPAGAPHRRRWLVRRRADPGWGHRRRTPGLRR